MGMIETNVKRQAWQWLLLAMVVAGGMFLVGWQSGQVARVPGGVLVEQGTPNEPVITPRVAAIGPIFINGSSDTEGWDDCPYINGTGMPGDPYRLENLTIVAGPRSDNASITIVDSQALFQVVNCTILPASYYEYGFYHNG